MQTNNKHITHLRQEYTLAELDESKVNPNPIKQFEKWFQEATQSQIVEPNAMVLSTVSECGEPWSRAVLLREFSEAGFVFYTNYRSVKGQHIEKTPRASLLFLWKELERQVRLQGTVSKVRREQSVAYFKSRPYEAQLSAFISPQSEVIGSRSELEKRFKEAQEKFKDGTVSCPEHWGGYCVTPNLMEFWQGREHRLHDRIQYKLLKNGNWERVRLAP